MQSKEQPLLKKIDRNEYLDGIVRRATRELDHAADGMHRNITSLLERGESLQLVEQESEMLRETSRRLFKASMPCCSRWYWTFVFWWKDFVVWIFKNRTRCYSCCWACCTCKCLCELTDERG